MACEEIKCTKVDAMALKIVIDRLDSSANRSILVASKESAASLSGNLLGEETKNNKTVVQGDGINPNYLRSVLMGETEGFLVFKKIRCDRFAMSCFRPKESALSGLFFSNDPATLSSDGCSWYFIQGIHADSLRYQLSNDVYQSLKDLERDRAYNPEDFDLEGLKYFSSECDKNACYIDSEISKCGLSGAQFSK